MARNQRIAFALVAVVIAVAAAVLLTGGSSDEAAETDRPPAAATSTTEAGPQDVTETPDETPTPEPTPTATPAPEVVSFRGGKVVGGSQKLSFEKGETARFSIASDVADEIHVHGYDIYKDVPAGGRARFSFKADIEGIFEVELHDRAIEVAQLRVEP